MSRQIFAFRVVGRPGEPWYGNYDALPAEWYETTILEVGSANPSQFAGKTLEVRHAEVPDDDAVTPHRIYVNLLVEGRSGRAYLREDVAAILFPGHD